MGVGERMETRGIESSCCELEAEVTFPLADKQEILYY